MRNRERSFESLLADLADTNAPLRAALIYRLSDPSPEDLAALQAAWPSIPAERRQLLLSRLTEASEVSFDLDFSAVALFALEDQDAGVRQQAVAALWERDDPSTMRRLIALLRNDPSGEVRAAAAQGLGTFVLSGEYGMLPQEVVQEAEEALLTALTAQEPQEVRRRALESIAYSSRKEVPPLIEQAAQDADIAMQASAIFAMGRSADEQWAEHIMRALDNPEPELRFEAARAAGEIGLVESISRLIELTQDEDREVKEAAIWSLGEIGGIEAQNALFDLANHEKDDELLEAIEDALNMAMLSTGEFVSYVFTRSEEDDDFEDLDYFEEDIEDVEDLLEDWDDEDLLED